MHRTFCALWETRLLRTDQPLSPLVLKSVLVIVMVRGLGRAWRQTVSRISGGSFGNNLNCRSVDLGALIAIPLVAINLERLWIRYGGGGEWLWKKAYVLGWVFDLGGLESRDPR
jgi:hypothetical protein